MADLENLMNQMMAKFDSQKLELGDQLTAIHKKLGHEIKDVATRVDRISEDITHEVQKKLEARGDAVFDQLKKKVDKTLEDALTQVQSSIEGLPSSTSRREEIRIGKQAASTSDEVPRNTSVNFNQPARQWSDPNNFEDEDTPPRRERNNRAQVDDDLSSLKVTIPSFNGTDDPNEFIDWKSRCELAFSCHNYSERKKVQMAVMEFKEYALVWWTKKVTRWNEEGEHPPESWNALIRLMEARFVPNDYQDELLQRLHSLTQGSKSVHDYYKEMEMLMLRAEHREDVRSTKYRFLNGLRREIREQVELCQYQTIQELRQLAMKIESHIKAKTRTFSKPGERPWQAKTWNKGADKNVQTKPKFQGDFKRNDKPPDKKPAIEQRHREVTCYRCN